MAPQIVGSFFMADEPVVPVQEPQKIQIEVVQSKPEQPPAPPEPERKDTGVEYKYNIEYQRFCDDLGMDRYKRSEPEVANKVAFLYDYAREQTGSEDGTTISKFISDLTRTLGYQVRGDTLVNTLFQWTRLDVDHQRLQLKQTEEDLIEQRLQAKQKIQAIEPRIKPEELEKRVNEGMKDIQKQIKRQVQSHITQSVNKGIKEALEKAATLR